MAHNGGGWAAHFRSLLWMPIIRLVCCLCTFGSARNAEGRIYHRDVALEHMCNVKESPVEWPIRFGFSQKNFSLFESFRLRLVSGPVFKRC